MAFDILAELIKYNIDPRKTMLRAEDTVHRPVYRDNIILYRRVKFASRCEAGIQAAEQSHLARGV